MAKQRVVSRVCDRCPRGREEDAKGPPIRFGLEEGSFIIDLCAKNRQDLAREIGAWARLGREATQAASSFINRDPHSLARTAELRYKHGIEERAGRYLLPDWTKLPSNIANCPNYGSNLTSRSPITWPIGILLLY